MEKNCPNLLHRSESTLETWSPCMGTAMLSNLLHLSFFLSPLGFRGVGEGLGAGGTSCLNVAGGTGDSSSLKFDARR